VFAQGIPQANQMKKHQCVDEIPSSRKCLFDDSKEKKIFEWTKEETCGTVYMLILGRCPHRQMAKHEKYEVLE
jgi:hypothetical protein